MGLHKIRKILCRALLGVSLLPSMAWSGPVAPTATEVEAIPDIQALLSQNPIPTERVVQFLKNHPLGEVEEQVYLAFERDMEPYRTGHFFDRKTETSKTLPMLIARYLGERDPFVAGVVLRPMISYLEFHPQDGKDALAAQDEDRWTLLMYVAHGMGSKNPRLAHRLLSSVIHSSPTRESLFLSNSTGSTLAMMIAENMGNDIESLSLLHPLIHRKRGQFGIVDRSYLASLFADQDAISGMTLPMFIARYVGFHHPHGAKEVLSKMFHPSLDKKTLAVQDHRGWNLSDYIHTFIDRENHDQKVGTLAGITESIPCLKDGGTHIREFESVTRMHSNRSQPQSEVQSTVELFFTALRSILRISAGNSPHN